MYCNRSRPGVSSDRELQLFIVKQAEVFDTPGFLATDRPCKLHCNVSMANEVSEDDHH